MEKLDGLIDNGVYTVGLSEDDITAFAEHRKNFRKGFLYADGEHDRPLPPRTANPSVEDNEKLKAIIEKYKHQ